MYSQLLSRLLDNRKRARQIFRKALYRPRNQKKNGKSVDKKQKILLSGMFQYAVYNLYLTLILNGQNIVFRSATIKILPKPSSLLGTTLSSAPSAKMKRFISSSLGLKRKGVDRKRKGWERRPGMFSILKSYY